MSIQEEKVFSLCSSFETRCLAGGLDDIPAATKSTALKILRRIEELFEGDSKVERLGLIPSQPCWQACSVFISNRANDKEVSNETPPVTCTQILRAFDVPEVEFFKELKQFILQHNPVLQEEFGDIDLFQQVRMKEITTTFTYDAIMAEKYRGCLAKWFEKVLSDEQTVVAPNHISLLTTFGWLTFLIAKHELLEPLPDLVRCFSVLLCAVNFLIAQAPSSALKHQVSQTSEFNKRTSSGAADTLASLCSVYGVQDTQPVYNLMKQVDLLMMRHLEPLSPASSEASPSSDLYSCAVYKDLLKCDLLQQAVGKLDQVYNKIYLAKGDLDERDTLQQPDAPQRRPSAVLQSPFRSPVRAAPRSPVVRSPNPRSPDLRLQRTPESRSNQLMLSPAQTPPRRPRQQVPFSPHRLSIEGTPVTSSLEATWWLKGVVAKHEDQPCRALCRELELCDTEFPEILKDGVAGLVERVFQTPEIENTSASNDSASGVTPAERLLAETAASAVSDSKQKRTQAIRLYYAVLQSILESEKQQGHNVATLLPNSHFHRALLFCACEVVAHCYKDSRVAFPKLAKLMSICPLEITKVIESFISHMEGLPRVIKHHLYELEWRILDSIAWQPSSAFYQLLAAARPRPAESSQEFSFQPHTPRMVSEAGTSRASPAPTNTQPSPPIQHSPPRRSIPAVSSMWSPETRRSAFRSFRLQRAYTPMADIAIYVPKSFGSPEQSYPGADARAERSIKFLLRKVVKLAEIRSRNLCERLSTDAHITQQVIRVVHHSIYEHTHLLFNRHLGQIILCSVYGVCKVNKIPTQFKQIIEEYKKFQDLCAPEIFRNVVIEQTEDFKVIKRDDIIKFYNVTFIPVIKKFLVTVNVSNQDTCPITESRTAAIAAASRGSDGFASILQKPSEDTEPSQTAPRSPPRSPVIPSADGQTGWCSPGFTSPTQPRGSNGLVSPKRVHSGYNVYVHSPSSRPLKRDPLCSPGSRRIISLSGEGTMVSQSFSNTLETINNQLSSKGEERQKQNVDDGMPPSKRHKVT